MAIAQYPPQRGATPIQASRFHRLQQPVGDILIFDGEVIRHPIAVEYKITGIAPEIFHAQTRAFAESCGAAHRMDASEETPHPFAFIASTEFRPAPATARKDRVAETPVDMQRFAERR